MKISACLRKNKILSVVVFAALLLPGCSGNDGDDGAPGAEGPVRTTVAESLDITIDQVSINSAPVVEMTIADENGIPMAGLTSSNMRFNIAKLMPGSNGDPSSWQNYINNSDGQGSSERGSGELEDMGNGQYVYTFSTDITDPAQTGDISYDPSLTHRVAIQVSGFPATNPTFDFRPDGGDITLQREIVKTETCNSCHNKLAIHGGGRIEMKYCVTCHNPGSIDPDSGNTVDFKVMVHKIHRGEDLPSVAFGPDLIEGNGDDGTGTYQIVGFRDSVHDYSTVVFPQDIRNCTKCHDGSDPDTPQGDNWKTSLSIEACGSCHDNIDFAKDGSDTGANDPLGHSGGIVSDNSECITCHAADRIGGSVEEAHANPLLLAATKFQYNILEVCGVAVDAAPDCAGAAPTVKFSVSDPTGATTHGYGNFYKLDSDPEYTASGAGLNLLTAWDSSDYTNDGGDGTRPARSNSVNLSAILASATDNTDGTYTMTLDPLPAGVTSGSAGVAMEGHPRGETVLGSGDFNISVPVRGEVAYFTVDGGTLVERRVAVDIQTKCDNCHNQLSLHGANRADNAQLCVMCHNPRNTDVGRRPLTGGGIPDVTATEDGKREESIDMKILIHAIHAGQKDDPATEAVEGHGVRENGIVVYGFRGSLHDYSHVRFPGILNDCTTCHNDSTFELTGKWQAPLQNGILATTTESIPTATDAASYDTEVADQSNDLMITPAAAVCSSCHDSALAQAHMETVGGALFDAIKANIDTSFETCSVCHGPGKSADVKVVHGVE